MHHIKLYPPAKINLHLEVGPARSTGYHDLRSVSVKLNLRDEMDVYLVDEGYRLVCDQLSDLPLEKDLLYKAMRFFQQMTGLSFGLDIRLKKNIPMQGGLGGGSSDAGLLLQFLNEHFGGAIPEATLVQQSVVVGADVPFFVHKCQAAYIAGLGEDITPLKPKQLVFLLCFPDFGVPTGEAYRYLDRYPSDWSGMDKEKLLAIWNEPPQEWSFFNSFSLKLKKEYPEFLQMEEFLNQFDIPFFTLSGSGSTYAILAEKSICQKIIACTAHQQNTYLDAVEALTDEHEN